MFAALTASGASCAPSRAYLFDPVEQTVRERTGLAPEWRLGGPPAPAVERRIRELLARPLTDENAALVAVLASPRLQADYERLGVAGAALAGARALPNPEADLAVRFPVDGGSTQIELMAVESISGLVGALLRTNAADADLRAARRRAVARTIDVAAAAKIAFYRASAAESLRALRRTIADATAASASLARGLHQAGNVTQLQLARELVAEETAALAAQAAEAEAVAARAELAAALGLGADAPEVGIGPLADAPAAPPDVTNLEADAVAASLDLDSLRLDLEAAGDRVDLARFQSFVPDVAAGVSAKREADEWGVGPAVRVSIPLFDWGEGKRAAAAAQVRRLRQELAAAALDVRAAARAARARLAAAHALALRMRATVLPLRAQLDDESLRQYNAMNLSAFELLVARREHVAAEERAVAALRDYWIARAEVDQLRAGALPRGRARLDDTKGDEP
ncbi:MAG TPA: TolC family protein [Haliangiales bacterium]|nr:TolC family protein [Haliangiales bacterium]